MENLFNKFIKTFGLSSENSVIEFKENIISFNLFFESLLIGELQFKNNKWFFSYSLEFKSQNDFKPLLEFPNIEKQYSTEELWPFFAYRIPGLKQPIVQEKIVKDNIDIDDIPTLLKTFGKQAIFNPFILESV